MKAKMQKWPCYSFETLPSKAGSVSSPTANEQASLFKSINDSHHISALYLWKNERETQTTTATLEMCIWQRSKTTCQPTTKWCCKISSRKGMEACSDNQPTLKPKILQHLNIGRQHTKKEQTPFETNQRDFPSLCRQWWLFWWWVWHYFPRLRTTKQASTASRKTSIRWKAFQVWACY